MKLCLRPTDFFRERGDQECMIYQGLGHMPGLPTS